MSQHNVLSLTANRFSGICTQDLSETEAESVIALALNVLKKQHQPGQALSRPDDTKAYLRIQLRDHKTEVFGALFLSNRHHVIANEILFQGTIDGASVHPRVVVQRALEVNAAALIVYHTHPSQVVEPSRADEAITRHLKDVLTLVDIRLLDHVVVCASDSVSFAESGLL